MAKTKFDENGKLWKKAEKFLSKSETRTYFDKLMNALKQDKSLSLYLDLSQDGQCYTDFKRVHISVLAPEIREDFGSDRFGMVMKNIIKDKGIEGLWRMLAKVAMSHEVDGHINCTVRKVHEDFMNEAIAYFVDTHGMNANIARQLCANLFNILEDGRVENSIMSRNPGMVKGFTLKNWIIRMDCSIEKVPGNVEEELHTFISLILSYTKTGCLPSGCDHVAKEEVFRQFESIMDLIDEVVYARTCREGTWAMLDIINIVGPYLAKLFAADSELANQLESALENYSQDESREVKNNSQSQGRQGHQKTRERVIQVVKKQEKKDSNESNSSQSSSEDDSKSGSESENDQSKSSGLQNTDKDSEQQSGGSSQTEEEPANEGNSSGEGDSSEEGDSSDEGNSSGEDASADDGNSSGEGDSSEDGNSSDEGNSSGEGDSSEAGDSSDEGNSSGEGDSADEGNSSGEDASADSSEGIDSWTDSRNSLDGYDGCPIDDSAWGDILSQISECEQEEKRSVAITTKKDAPKSRIAKQASRDMAGGYEEIKLDFSLVPIPANLSLISSRLKREFEKILFIRNKNIRGLRKGSLDTRALYKVGTKDIDVFQQRMRPGKDFVFYILRDSSGSMSGEKDRESAQTCAILEESLRKFASLKIVSFCDFYQVQHYIMRDFKDKGPNRSLGFYKAHPASGGNKDGMSIRIATAELAARKEKEKVLFVLSDGLPSGYGSQTAALNDVRCAVEEARAKGIKVISIMYGDEHFIDRELEAYSFMYQKDILSCAPKDLTKVLIPVFKSLFKA